MVVRLHNLSKWRCMEPGKGLDFLGDAPRKVRVEFNTEQPTRIDLVHGEDDDTQVTFLAVIMGMETVEFVAPVGTYLAATSDGEVWYFTNEGDDIATDREEVSFTKVMNRRSRNPELERMMFKMEQNMNARMALMAEEVAAQVAAAGVQHDTATGEVEDDEVGDGLPDGSETAPTGATGGSPEPAPSGADNSPAPKP